MWEDGPLIYNKMLRSHYFCFVSKVEQLQQVWFVVNKISSNKYYIFFNFLTNKNGKSD